MRYEGPEVRDFRCPYLPGKTFQSLGLQVDEISAEEFEVLLSRGFRRSYRDFYTPVCAGCRECRSIRVPVAGFQPSKSQRKVWRLNQDVEVRVEEPSFTEEKLHLYNRYQVERWGRPGLTRDLYQRYEVFHFGFTKDFEYWLNGELIGLGRVDTTPKAASSVYFSYCADPRRALGTFSMLYEIEWCRQTGRDYLYMGLWIPGCKTMSYKTNFGPHEIMERGSEWKS